MYKNACAHTVSRQERKRIDALMQGRKGSEQMEHRNTWIQYASHQSHATQCTRLNRTVHIVSIEQYKSKCENATQWVTNERQRPASSREERVTHDAVLKAVRVYAVVIISTACARGLVLGVHHVAVAAPTMGGCRRGAGRGGRRTEGRGAAAPLTGLL